MATEMAQVHNTFLRSFNSILLQAPLLPSCKQTGYNPTDVKDLLFFVDTTLTALNHHHDGEEKILFPALEKEIGQPGYLDGASEQHKLFHDGVGELQGLVRELREKPGEWEWEGMKRIIEGFMPALERHLREEVPLILGLERYAEEGLRRAWDASVEEGKKVGFGAFVGSTSTYTAFFAHSISYPISAILSHYH